MGKKSMSTISFADLTGGKRRNQLGKKKVKKAAKFHLKEMKISKKEFAKVYDEYSDGKSMKKARMNYRREHANELAEILLAGKMKKSASEKYEGKLNDYIADGKLFNIEKKSDMRKVAKKAPALFAYGHMIDNYPAEMIKSVMKTKVRRLSKVMDERNAILIAPLTPKSDLTKVLRVILKAATDKDPKNFDAKEFFQTIRPKLVTKREWKIIVVQTVLGWRGTPNNAIKDVINYSLTQLNDMPKDTIKKVLKRYADNISKVADSGEKLTFIVTLKDLSDYGRIERVLDKNSNLATKIGRI